MRLHRSARCNLAAVPQRNYALDLLRGLTIALMIVVNNPGDWQAMFRLLRHAEWHGFLGADIVFPFFIFIAGYAAALKIERVYLPIKTTGPHCASALTLLPPETPPFVLPLLRRAALLFLLGVLLNAWPFGLLPGSNFALGNVRLMGVLQRIALCVLIGGFLVRCLPRRRHVVAAGLLLIGIYELGMRGIRLETQFGQFGASFLLQDNFARFVDLALLPESMLYKMQGIAFDPEGIFSTLTATVTFLLGALAYRFRNGERYYFVGALACLAVATSLFEPLNKNLWTVPYVMVTACAASAILTALERLSWPAWARRGTAPLAMIGRKPLFVYVLSILIGKALVLWKIDTTTNAKKWLYWQLSLFPVAGEWRSLLYSVILLVLLLLLARLHERWQHRGSFKTSIPNQNSESG